MILVRTARNRNAKNPRNSKVLFQRRMAFFNAIEAKHQIAILKNRSLRGGLLSKHLYSRQNKL